MENQNVIASSYTHVDNGGIDVKVINDGTIMFETSYYGYPSIQVNLNLSSANKKGFYGEYGKDVF